MSSEVAIKTVCTRWLQALSVAINLAVFVAWGWFLSRQLGALRSYSWQIAPLAALSSVGLGAAYFVALALSWGLLLHKTSGGQFRLGAAAQVWLSSMLTRYMPGNVWHILRRVLLANSLNVTRTQVLSSSTVEQVLTLLGALAVFGLSLPFWAAAQGYTMWLLLIPLGLLALHPRVLGRLLAWAAHRTGRPELAWHYGMRDILQVLACYTGAFVLHGLGLLALVAGIAPTQPGDVPVVIGAAALAWALGFLSFFTPSGLGVREAVLTALLLQVYPEPVAIIAALLFRLAQTLGEALALAAGWLRERGL